MTSYDKALEPRIWFTSDTHFGHNKDFVWTPRRCESLEEMHKKIITNWNIMVAPNDIVYHLGDVMLGDNTEGLYLLSQLNGKFHIILGNHDTPTRIKLYEALGNVIDIKYADMIKCGKQHYYLSHYPTMTSNYDDKPYHNHTINLFGHTHQEQPFFNDNPFMFNVGMDAHNCYPISLEMISKEIHDKVQELYQYKVQQAKAEKEYYENGLGYFEQHPLGVEILD